MDETTTTTRLRNRRNQPMLDESAGVRSKYWTFTCGRRSEFDGGKPYNGLNRLQLAGHKGVYCCWTLRENGPVSGYVEYREAVTENEIKNYHGSDFVGQHVKRRPHVAPEGYYFEEEDVNRHMFECKECNGPCFDRCRTRCGLYDGFIGLCENCGGDKVTKAPGYIRAGMKRKRSIATDQHNAKVRAEDAVLQVLAGHRPFEIVHVSADPRRPRAGDSGAATLASATVTATLSTGSVFTAGTLSSGADAPWAADGVVDANINAVVD